MTIRKKSVSQRKQDQQQVRERILEVFSEKARRSGIRAVGMVELAEDLHMSASTLYNHFPSKRDLVIARVERWAEEFAADRLTVRAPGDERSSFERFVDWAEAWAEAWADLSPAFIDDMRRDHPKAWKKFQKHLDERKKNGAAVLLPSLKLELNGRVALTLLELIIEKVIDPRFADRLRVSRRDAMVTAISIWASGALVREGKLHLIPPKKNTPDS